jgi:hypothetical protein
MQAQFFGRGLQYPQWRTITLFQAHPGLRAALADPEAQPKVGLPAGHGEIDFCQDLRIQQGAMQATIAVVYFISFT